MDIQSFIEKSMDFGLGLAAYSREKIEDLVEELVRKGDVAQKDARKFAGDLISKGEEQKAELKKLVNNEVTSILDKMDLVRKSEVQEQIKAALREAGVGQTTEQPASADTKDEKNEGHPDGKKAE
jgi:polyhydroxyalkanoate synthesis regulator phasin